MANSASRAFAKRASLSDELRLFGFLPLPQVLVREQKARMLEGRSLVLRALREVAGIFSLLDIALYLGREFRTPYLFSTVLLVVAIDTVAGVGMTGWLCAHGPAPGILIASAYLLCGACIIYIVFELSERLHSLSARWERIPLRLVDDEEGDVTVEFDGVASVEFPMRVISLVEQVERLPRTRLEVHAIGADPFLYAVRGWGPWAERVAIAAWGTGNPQLDNWGRDSLPFGCI